MARQYPWSVWFESGRFTLLKGRDYTCTQMSMSQQVRNVASKKGYKVTVSEVPGGLLVQVTNTRKPESLLREYDTEGCCGGGVPK